MTIPIATLPPDSAIALRPSRARTRRPAAILVDTGAAPVPTPGTRRQPAAVGVVVKPTPRPKPETAGGGGHVLRGKASWYCNNDGSRAQISACHYRYPDTGGFNAYAAAGPKLRAALGGGDRWRNRVVSVDGIRVKLVDWCQCYKGESHEKLIDLYLDVYRRTGGACTIRW